MSLTRLLATAFLCVVPVVTQAACSGATLLDRFSDEQRAALDEAVRNTPFGEGLFWIAEKDGKEITLAGTMHLYDDRHLPLLDRVAPQVAKADLLLVEMAPQDEMDMQRAMADDPSMVFISDGPTLPEKLPEELWQELAAAARERQVPAFIAAKYQPWFLSMTLSIPTCAIGDLASGLQGLDHMIMEEAEAGGVAIASLEDWRTLPDHFASIPFEEQIDMLRMALIEPELQSETFVAMLESYFDGRIAQIPEMTRMTAELLPPDQAETLLSGFDLTMDLLLDARNLAWMPVILDAAERHDEIVVAAGAAHMPGETGLLALLEAEGWEIRPLP